MLIHTLTKWLPGRKRKRPITTIVLHATAGSTAQGAIATLRDRGLSYHAIIEDQREQDGEINKCVPDSMVAYHAGKSFGPEGPNVNYYSLGAALVNLNDGKDPVSAKQYNAMLDRCVSWCEAYPSIRYLTTHWAISPGRKSDPRDTAGFRIRQFHRDLVRKLGREIYLWLG